MPKNYSESYYLEQPDILALMENYHQAYLEKYPDHFLSHQDDRFWQNEAGEFIFYAGEQALLDEATEGVRQPLGRHLYDSTLTLAARFLELDLAELPSDTIHITSLINLDRGHWTSVVLSLENVDRQKYQEIYALYRQFKQYIRDTKPGFVITHEQSCTNIFMQYATGNRHGAVVEDVRETELAIRAFFTSIGKENLLALKPKEGEKDYIEGNLELVICPKDSENIGVFHFDSMLFQACHLRVEQACSRFLAANNVTFAWAQNLQRQAGATCGEHAILNSLRYVFFKLNNVVASKNLRTATNHFCPEFARLFLFDYEQKTFEEAFNLILGEQLEKEQALVSTGVKKTTEPKQEKQTQISPGQLVAIGIIIGVAITLLSGSVLAPALGILNPVMASLFSVAVGLVTAGVGYMVSDQLIEEQNEIFSFVSQNHKSEKISEEQKLLESLSKTTFEAENPNSAPSPKQKRQTEVLAEPAKIYTPAAAPVSSVEQPVTNQVQEERLAKNKKTVTLH
jgi:hypothetical protein